MRKISQVMITALSLSTLVGIASADNLFKGDWALGVDYSTMSGDDFALMATKLNDRYLFDLGFGYEDTDPASGDDFHLYEVRSRLGLRHKLSSFTTFDYGIGGSYGFRSTRSATRDEPYEFGAFLGLSTVVNKDILLSAKVYPYDHEHAYNKNVIDRSFSEGSISISYIF